MVIITTDVQKILDDYIDRYCSFHQKGEYGISRFWQWYLNTLRDINTIDNYITRTSDRITQSVSLFTTITFSAKYINGEIVLRVYGINVDRKALEKWIGFYKIKTVGSCNFGYNIIVDNFNQFGIQGSNGVVLIKPYYDKIIPFHHCQHDYNQIHAIGIKGNRVFAIKLDGDTEMLPISLREYENSGCQHSLRAEETKLRRRKNVIHLTESQLRNIIYESVLEAISNKRMMV